MLDPEDKKSPSIQMSHVSPEKSFVTAIVMFNSERSTPKGEWIRPFTVLFHSVQTDI